ncbi:MAG: hypothetical protein H7Z75_15085 [Ferruginibacter sp.]|nr:hypothetical protein [Cytophagales bacterium]
MLAIVLAFLGCRESKEEVTPENLSGVWVEVSARADTLVLNRTAPRLAPTGNPESNTLTVNRGRAVNAGGHVVPKIGSGPYQFYIREGRIHVRSFLSSNSKFSDHAIEQRKDGLRIENFFEVGFNQPATAVRTFVRLP